MIDEVTQKWLKEQKREDVIAEILYSGRKTSLSDLRKIGWTNGFPDRYRTPAWHLLLHYLPVSKSKRETTLRRKRIEYHRHITKHYFEFDFCLTDRKLSSSTTPQSSAASSKRGKSSTPPPKRKLSVNSQLHQLQSEKLFQASLMPLFSQPSAPPPPQDTNREDSLLLQIRDDINKMVKIPVSSSSKSSSRKKHHNNGHKSHHQQRRNSRSKFTVRSNFEDDIHGEHSTTTNRLFANHMVKGSLERILYLWSIRIQGSDSKNQKVDGFASSTLVFSNSSPTSRYMPGIVDLVYPLYLINIYGYIWRTHISTSIQIDESTNSSNDINIDCGENDGSKDVQDLKAKLQDNFLMKLGMKLEYDDGDDAEKKNGNEEEEDDDKKSDSSVTYQSEVLEQEARELKLSLCKDLSIGKGIDLIPEEILDEIEADTFWCLENMMNAIQDYRFNDAFFETVSKKSSSSKKSRFKLREKDGLQKMIILTEKVLQRVDPDLSNHLKSTGIEFQWFTFRWMNTLHVRTMNENCMIRLWDTCLCEEIDKNSKGFDLNYFTTFGFNSKRSKKRLHLSGFLSFQIYLSAALLHQLREKILSVEGFGELLYLLRNLSLDNWGEREVSMLLSQAFVWKETFGNSENQLFMSATEKYGENTLSTWVQEKSHWPPRKDAQIQSKNLKSILPKTILQGKAAFG